MICEKEMRIPKHHEEEMIFIQKGNFRKIDFLKCKNCDYEIEIPKHCGVPMLYVDENYYPVYKLSEGEIKEMKKIYGD
ncbi:hypothetical protein CM19_10880 [Candidatus Acidianus copahuensis]|uniref:Uncharacterized protein n=2 Tax=Sulfolobaceae TaxID=118883 RepID=A0A031LKG5_9CREN|nr:hypothetical protein CM19_10880 [Candidatus Acidianus copahuensis]NON62675.1 hypothetical protein [Acidianus sp. RZ1]